MDARLRTCLLSALVVVMSVAGVAGAAPVAFTNEVVANTAAVEYQPEIVGAHIVWTAYSPLALDKTSDVKVLNLASGVMNTIGGGDGVSQFNPDVSLGRIVYEDESGGNRNVIVWDNVLNVHVPIAASAEDEVAPRIDGNLVVWHRPSVDELWYRDLARGITAKVTGADHVEFFDVDNGRIVWSEANLADSIFYYEPGLSTEPHFVRNISSSKDIMSLQLHGTRVAYTVWDGSESDVEFVELSGWWSLDMTSDSKWEEGPVVFHQDVAWDDSSSGSHDIFFWPFEGPQTDVATVADGALAEYDASMFGRRIAYSVEPGMFNADIRLASADREVARTAGDDRYLTAVEVSKAYFDGAENAVLCTGLNFPDALSAAPLARHLHAPLLLTRPGAVDAATLDQFEGLGVKDVYVVGGPSVVSDAVLAQLVNAGYSAHRIAGADRYETSAEVARELKKLIRQPYVMNRAFFARGDNFPDALAVGPVAAAAHAPILLVKPTELPASVAEAVDDLNLVAGFIAGGSDVVSNGVRDSLRAVMIANGGDGGDPQLVDRWAGDTRYDTAVAIVEQALAARLIDLDTLGVATGLNFPDALGGGAALGWYGSPLVLTKPTELPAGVTAFLEEHEYEIGRLDVFGGSDVVSDAVKNAIAAKLK